MVKPDLTIFDRALANVSKALSAVPEVTQATGTRVELELENRVAHELTSGLPLGQWYESKLTARQREFVDLPLDRSVRLKGPAGTGKTLALVVKLLRVAHEKLDANAIFRVVFLTHSMATVEIVRSMIIELDDRGVLFSTNPQLLIRVSTLQELANETLAYDLADLQPLSSDALEGRILQMEVISSLVTSYRESDWPLIRSECSPAFRHYFESPMNSPQQKYFVWELMNEFACVLDAEVYERLSVRRINT